MIAVDLDIYFWYQELFLFSSFVFLVPSSNNKQRHSLSHLSVQLLHSVTSGGGRQLELGLRA
jgi:hypothetical protein